MIYSTNYTTYGLIIHNLNLLNQIKQDDVWVAMYHAGAQVYGGVDSIRWSRHKERVYILAKQGSRDRRKLLWMYVNPSPLPTLWITAQNRLDWLGLLQQAQAHLFVQNLLNSLYTSYFLDLVRPVNTPPWRSWGDCTHHSTASLPSRAHEVSLVNRLCLSHPRGLVE